MSPPPPPVPPPPAPPPDDPLVGVELNGYQIRSVMAEGGMGKVYLAVHPLVGAKAAIKVMLPQFAADVEQSERFVREARVLATLNHDRILKIMGFGNLEDGRQYMITEHLEGASLERIIEREAPMPPAKALALVDQILDALSAAHAAGVVHRDLKPANVIVKQVGTTTERKLKLLDFGLARARVLQAPVDPSMPLNKASQVMGTPEYMAPEQARGFAPTPASDLYSVGVILFELLTHRLPFLATGVIEMMRHHVSTPPPRVGVLVPSIPPELENLVHQLLSKTPEERGAPAERVRQKVQALLRELAEPEARKLTTGEVKAMPRPGAPTTAEATSRSNPAARVPQPVAESQRSSGNLRPAGPVPEARASGPRPSSSGEARGSSANAGSNRDLKPQITPASPVERDKPPSSGSIPVVTPTAQPKVDPAYAAARERAMPQVKSNNAAFAIAFVLSIGLAVLVGMGLERYLASKRAPTPAPVVAVPVVSTPAAVAPDNPVLDALNAGVEPPDAGAAPVVRDAPVIVATPEARDPQELCKDVAHWRSELLGNVKALMSVYKAEHPGAVTEEPPLKELSELRNKGLAVDAVDACVKLQKGIDAWELKHIKVP
jgi:serine/threonine protein kinase